jgi:hypothetical protein
MRGSLLVTFFDQDGKGGDYLDISVNGVIVKRIYNPSNNLYSAPLLIGDVVTIDFVDVPTFFTDTITNNRFDYTTDDENGDMGIKETSIVVDDFSSSYTFTVSSIECAYDFEYQVILNLIIPTPTPTPTITPTPTSTPTPTPLPIWSFDGPSGNTLSEVCDPFPGDSRNYYYRA